MRARAVPTCWPISARMIETVTMPLRSMRYQIVGSNSSAGEVEAASAPVKPGRGKPNRTLVPAAPIRKLRRDTGFCFITGPASTLSMCASHFGRNELDRPAAADIGHASAQAAAHDGVDILVGRVGKILEQRCGLHDLSGLAIAALRCLRLNPGFVQRMLTIGVEPLDRRVASATAPSGVMQERTARPSMCTVHAPHMPMPQPNFVPLSPISSRMTHRSGVSSATLTETGRSLSLKVVMITRLQTDFSL